MSIFSWLFSRAPKYHTSAYADLYSAVVSTLTSAGLTVGGTAAYPRVEVHSILEGERLDKDGAIRLLTLTVESMSKKSLAQAASMNETAMQALTEEELDAGEDWTVVAIEPQQLQDMTEASDTTAILYRIIQTYEVYIERVKTDDTEEEETNE